MQIIGAGGHAKVVISTLRALGKKIDSIFDDNCKNLPSEFFGVSVKGTVADATKNLDTYLAIGNNSTRKTIAESTSLKWGKALVHPQAWLDPSVEIGVGSVVFAGAVIQVDSIIGNHVIINTNASVDHDCKIFDYAHLAPGCNVCGGVEIGEAALLGVGTKVIPQIKVGANAVLGAGSVVIRQVEDGQKMIGVPAKKITSIASPHK